MIACEIKSVDAEDLIKRCPLAGNMQEYIIPSAEESLVIAHSWLESEKMSDSHKFKIIAKSLNVLRQHLIPSKVPTELTQEELNNITEDRTLEIQRTFSLRKRFKLFSTRF